MARGKIFTTRLADAASEQRRALMDDLEEVFISQHARILARFAGQDAEKEAERWAEGVWVGRTGLELDEVRR